MKISISLFSTNKGLNIKYILLTVFFLFISSACSTSDSNQNTINLLSLETAGYKSISFDGFNKKITNASTASKEWTKDPVLIAHSFVGGSFGKEVVISIDKTDSGYNATMIFDKTPDDSIRGYRYDIKISENNSVMQNQAKFQISDARKRWNCWEGRGHKGYSNEPCI